MNMNKMIAAALLLVPLPAFAASVYLDPDTGNFGVGDTFVASIRLDNGDECINAAHVEVGYPNDVLKAVDFSRGSSIFSLWVEEPKIDQEHGLVTFSGGIPGGYCGRIPGDPALSNILGKIVFLVTGNTQHSATVSVRENSALYLNDGRGTK